MAARLIAAKLLARADCLRVAHRTGHGRNAAAEKARVRAARIVEDLWRREAGPLPRTRHDHVEWQQQLHVAFVLVKLEADARSGRRYY